MHYLLVHGKDAPLYRKLLIVQYVRRFDLMRRKRDEDTSLILKGSA